MLRSLIFIPVVTIGLELAQPEEQRVPALLRALWLPLSGIRTGASSLPWLTLTVVGSVGSH
jgi:hypothetical protein